MENNMANHICKTCVFYKPIHEDAKRGECTWLFKNKTPDAMHTQQSFMYEHEGAYCPCWEEREEKRRKEKKSNG